MNEENKKLLSVEEASKLFKLQYTQTRALLGEPDSVESTDAGRIRLLFYADRINSIIKKREEQAREKQKNAGKRSCYLCKNKFDYSELTDYICPRCHARKLIRNFICDGSPLINKASPARLKLLYS